MNLIESDRLADTVLDCKPERRMFENIREFRIALLTWERTRAALLVFVYNNLDQLEATGFSTHGWLRRAGGA